MRNGRHPPGRFTAKKLIACACFSVQTLLKCQRLPGNEQMMYQKEPVHHNNTQCLLVGWSNHFYATFMTNCFIMTARFAKKSAVFESTNRVSGVYYMSTFVFGYVNIGL